MPLFVAIQQATKGSRVFSNVMLDLTPPHPSQHFLAAENVNWQQLQQIAWLTGNCK